ncbi:hypothetical protein GGI12_002061 [Dipsacomyces acuminosporus]|nr:hypothetical protein GGI12_002061 [Dipsacomyces acuminosporus]
MFVKTIAAFAAAAAAAAAAFVSAAAAQSAGKLVVFGASMEDNGSTPHKSASPAYWNGRYSNSYTWPEYTAKILGLTLSDNAYGGATSNNSFAYAQGAAGPIPSVADAVQDYLNANANETPGRRQSHIVLIDVGGNDVFYRLGDFLKGAITPAAFAQGLAANIYKSVGVLLDAGFRNIHVANIQPLAVMPFAIQSLVVPLAASIENAILDAHRTALASFKQQRGSAASKVSLFDLDTAMRTYMGLSVTIPMNVWNPVVQCTTTDLLGNSITCSDPDNHLFYDSFHPSGRPHYLLGAVFARKIHDPSFDFNANNYIALIKQYGIGNSSATNNIIVNGA